MASWYYCMKCGAQCAGYASEEFKAISKYIPILEDGRSVRFQSEEHKRVEQKSFRTVNTENEYRKNRQIPGFADDALLRRTIEGNNPPIFEMVAYNIQSNSETFHCNTEFKLDPRYMESRSSIERYEIFEYDEYSHNTAYCPVCGEKLVKAQQFYTSSYSSVWDKFFSVTKQSRQNHYSWWEYTLECYEEDRIISESDGYVEKVKLQSKLPLTRISTENLDVQSFLEHFINAEKSIMFLTDLLKELLPIQHKAERLAYREQCMGKKLQQEAIDRENARIQKELENVKKQHPMLSEDITESDLGMTPPHLPLLKKSNIFNRNRINRENADATAAYEREMHEYKEEVERRKAIELERRRKLNEESQMQIQQEEDRLSVEMKHFEEKLLKSDGEETVIQRNNKTCLAEIDRVKEDIRKLCDLRAQLIATGVVHPKYTDFVALTTIYEYFETGRCAALTGPDGAYNIYESECRANRIIAQLDKIIMSLETIKANQYRTYCTLLEIKEGIEGLSTKLSGISTYTQAIANNTAYIAYNTAMTAHYAKINAELTNALGFLVALK